MQPFTKLNRLSAPRSALVGAVVAAIIGVAAGPASALIPGQSLEVTANDSKSTAKCTLTVKSVDYTNQQVLVGVNAQIRPDGLMGYFNDIGVLGECTVNDNQPNIGGFVNAVNGHGATASNSDTFGLPLLPSYRLCATANTETRSGSSYTSPYVCKNS